MKKYIIILATAVCAFCACQKHEIELLDKPVIEQIDCNTFTYTFSAIISDKVSEVEEDGTKATVSRAGAFTWAVGDKLKFFPSEGDPANAEVTDVSGSTATITVTTGSPRSNFVSAIYPADAALSKDRISFNARGPIVVADVTSGTLTFYHIGSLINLKFYEISAMDDIKSLVFEPETAFSYDGTFTFDASHVPSLTTSGTTISKIVVPASKADNNRDITVVVPSVILSGFSAALNSAEDGSGRNIFKKSTSTSHNLAENSPVLMNMQRVAYEAPTKFYVTTVSPSKYWDKQGVRMIQTGADTYAVQMNCDGGTDVYIYDNYNTDNYSSGYLNKGHVDGGNFYEITWNSSSSTGGPNYVSATRNKPFYNNDYPTGEMAISGSFNAWSHNVNLFTYNANMSWVCEGLSIASAGTYKFKIRKAQEGEPWAYQAGVNSGLGSQLYGSLKGDTGDASVNLEAGTYSVYLNATSDWYYNIMFEKQ